MNETEFDALAGEALQRLDRAASGVGLRLAERVQRVRDLALQVRLVDDVVTTGATLASCALALAVPSLAGDAPAASDVLANTGPAGAAAATRMA